MKLKLSSPATQLRDLPRLFLFLVTPVLLITIFLAAPLAQAETKPDSQNKIQFEDDFGQQISLPAPATRIIALYSAFNQILLKMDLADVIAARTNTETSPAVLAALPSIGTHLRPNIELIIGLKPDLVIQAGGRKNSSLPFAALQKQGIVCAQFKLSSFADLYNVIEKMGLACAAKQKSDALITNMQTELGNISRKIDQIKQRPNVFYEVRYPNLLAAGRGGIVNEIISLAGGVNSVTSAGKLIRLNEETLLSLNPDYYIYQKGPMNPNPVPPEKRAHFKHLQAVKNRQYFLVDEKTFSRPGPASVASVLQLAKILHPDIFANNPQGDNK